MLSAFVADRGTTAEQSNRIISFSDNKSKKTMTNVIFFFKSAFLEQFTLQESLFELPNKDYPKGPRVSCLKMFYLQL